jgi:hypothetical protein
MVLYTVKDACSASVEYRSTRVKNTEGLCNPAQKSQNMWCSGHYSQFIFKRLGFVFAQRPARLTELLPIFFQYLQASAAIVP